MLVAPGDFEPPLPQPGIDVAAIAASGENSEHRSSSRLRLLYIRLGFIRRYNIRLLVAPVGFKKFDPNIVVEPN